MATDPARAVDAWRARGRWLRLAGYGVFTVDIPATAGEHAEPLLVLHGFPTSSFDFHGVVDALAVHRRVLLLDLVGYGLSSKPDRAYTLSMQADVVIEWCRALGIRQLSLLTHDMGDTVGGELLARQLEGAWEVEIVRRVLTNGSIYIEMAQLSAGQQLLLALPDEPLPAASAPDATALARSLAATFAPDAQVDDGEVGAMAALVTRDGGARILPRLIRYIEERRRHQHRWTGAIEAHPAPLAVVWGAEDPIAVVDMAHRLGDARPDATVTVLDGVGHYPMVEAPQRFVAAVRGALEPPTAP